MPEFHPPLDVKRSSDAVVVINYMTAEVNPPTKLLLSKLKMVHNFKCISDFHH